jgi:hypothetical protein
MAITFEELLPLFGLSGDASASESPVVNGPANIIRTTEGWQVDVKWTTTGWLNNIMCGQWKISVLLEKMGGGEFNLAGGNVNVPFVSAPHAYSTTISFGAGSVPAGLYRASVVITMEGPLGTPGPVAGYEDLGMLQFYNV